MKTNYQSGHDAEKSAAEYLVSQGYEILDINWKTRYCEIDIVAKKDGIVYFVEVKSRKNTDFGSGLEYITPKKLKQMTFAAEMWVQSQVWSGDYQLAAIALDGQQVTFVDEL